jgi:hypothetical protein
MFFLNLFTANLCADPDGLCTMGSQVSSISGQTYCSTCTPGKYSNKQSKSSRTCTSCPKGTYSSNFGSSSCSLCPKNFFSDNFGASSCSECPKPSFTNMTGATSILDCKVQSCSDWQNVSDSNGQHFFTNSNQSFHFWKAQDYCQSLKHGAHLPSPKTSPLVSFLLPTSTVWMGMFMLSSNSSYAQAQFFWADKSTAPSSGYLPSMLSTCSYSSMSIACVRKTGTSIASINCGSCEINSDLPFWCQIDEEYCAQNRCRAGQFLDHRTAPYNCSLCSPGRFQNEENSIDCIDCPKGTFSRLGQSACDYCPVGTHSPSVGSSVCLLCPGGKSTSNPGALTCDLCSVGRFSRNTQDNSTVCQACPLATFANDTGLTVCFKCSNNGETKKEGSISNSDCVCPDDYFGNATLGQCHPCPQGDAFSCPVGAVVPWIKPGFFRAGTSFPQLAVAYSCIPASGCSQTEYQLRTTCANGYKGNNCGKCDDGFYRFALECKACPSYFWKVITILIVFFLFTLMMTRLLGSRSHMPVDLRVIIQAIQIVALFPNFTIKWPSFLMSIFQGFAFLVSHYRLMFLFLQLYLLEF